MKRSPAGVVATIDIVALLPTPCLNVLKISINNSLAEKGSVAHIRHLGPIIGSKRMEAANSLTSWIVFDKLNVSRNIDLSLLLCNLLVFFICRLRAISTAVMNDIFDTTKETWMAMKISLSIFWTIPFSIE
jgi:hypothetical protein